VNLRRRLWLVRPRKAATRSRGADDRHDRGLAAFIAADAWGDFDGSDYAKQLYAAGWPKDIRPYNAKHTVAIALAKPAPSGKTSRTSSGTPT
jgi:hypothetical protein